MFGALELQGDLGQKITKDKMCLEYYFRMGLFHAPKPKLRNVLEAPTLGGPLGPLGPLGPIGPQVASDQNV